MLARTQAGSMKNSSALGNSAMESLKLTRAGGGFLRLF